MRNIWDHIIIWALVPLVWRIEGSKLPSNSNSQKPIIQETETEKTRSDLLPNLENSTASFNDQISDQTLASIWSTVASRKVPFISINKKAITTSKRVKLPSSSYKASVNAVNNSRSELLSDTISILNDNNPPYFISSHFVVPKRDNETHRLLLPNEFERDSNIDGINGFANGSTEPSMSSEVLEQSVSTEFKSNISLPSQNITQEGMLDNLSMIEKTLNLSCLKARNSTASMLKIMSSESSDIDASNFTSFPSLADLTERSHMPNVTPIITSNLDSNNIGSTKAYRLLKSDNQNTTAASIMLEYQTTTSKQNTPKSKKSHLKANLNQSQLSPTNLGVVEENGLHRYTSRDSRFSPTKSNARFISHKNPQRSLQPLSFLGGPMRSSYSYHKSYSSHRISYSLSSPSHTMFDPSSPTNLSAQLGSSAYLPCKIRNLGNKTVSWIRNRDSHILTVDRYTFIADQRFQSWHEEESDVWTLVIRYVQERDDGQYECQVSTEPKMSHFVHFHVVSPLVRIPGGTDIHVKIGSTVALKCVISAALKQPDYIFWYQGYKRVVSSADGRKIYLDRIANDSTVGTLIIPHATPQDAGLYQCVPEKLNPANVTLHVLNGEHPAAMQHGTSVMTRPGSPKLSITTLVLIYLLNKSLLHVTNTFCDYR